MEISTYQEMAMKTAIYPEQAKIIYTSLLLASEAGEVAGKIGKILRDENGEFSEELLKPIMDEMGDVMWALAALAKDLNFDLTEVAKRNLAKLKDRQDRNVLSGSGDNR